MNTDQRRLADIAAAALMLTAGLVLTFFVFPDQIPEGLKGDLSSGHYPRAIVIVWIASSAIWLVRAAFFGVDDEVAAIPSLRRTVLIALSVLAGYALFTTIGFLVAAFFLIVVLTRLCGERGIALWILALAVPVTVYVFLLWVLEVRLPTILLG